MSKLLILIISPFSVPAFLLFWWPSLLGIKLLEGKDPLCDPELFVEHLEKNGCQ